MDKNEIKLEHKNGEPIIRVFLFQGQKHVDFVLKKPFDVYDLTGKKILEDINSKLRWRIKIKENNTGEEVFRLILWETKLEDEVKKKLKAIKKIDPEAEIEEIGGDIFLNDKYINNNVKYRVYSRNYENEDDARDAMVKFRPDFNPLMDILVVENGSGNVELFDSEYEHSAEIESGLKIVPHNQENYTHFFEIRKYNTFFQKEHFKDYYFSGTTEFGFDSKGYLYAVSEIPLEVYLKRAIFSESTSELPIEFYKSLAIALRSEIFSRFGHNHISEPFDFCDWGHCIRYYGNKFSDENIDKAVEESRGQVLKQNDNQIFDAYFTTICGGHTEKSAGLWETKSDASCTAKYDAKSISKKFKGLKEEDAVHKWINSRPDTFCNLQGKKVPRNLLITNSYFRWEVEYLRREMRELIKQKLGMDLGELIDIVPVQRSKSGRIKEVELIGSLKSIKIKGELNIRSTLAHDYLESSCFVVEKELDDDGFPLAFTIMGAGQGHGMGMCKTGASVMAIEGYNFKEIIEHYFDCADIDKLY